MDITVKVEGLKGVEDALADLGPKLARSALRKGLSEAAKPMVAKAKALAPVDNGKVPGSKPGELRDSIGAVVQTKKDGSAKAIIGPRYNKADGNQSPGVYGKFVEFGSVHNPVPSPFLRASFDGSNKEALDKFVDVVRAALPGLGK